MGKKVKLAPIAEPKVITGLWLADRMHDDLDRAESIPVMVGSSGNVISPPEYEAAQNAFVKRAMGYAKRLKALVEPKKGRK